MFGIAGFAQLHSQSADVAELMRRMTSPLTPRGAGRRKVPRRSRIVLGHRQLGDLAPLFRTFGMKLGNAFAKVFARAQAARRGMSRSFPRRHRRCDGALVVVAHQLCAGPRDR
jgi:hypothetical protein